MNKNVLIIGATAVVSLAAGAAGGYFFAKKQLTAKYEDLAKREIAEAKDFYKVLHKKDEFETPEKAAAELIPVVNGNEFSEAADAMKVYQGEVETKTETDVEVVVQKNIFTQIRTQLSENDEAWERETRNRTEEAPYVLKQAEFMAGELEYQQVTLTYYSGDKVLVDEREDIIEDKDDLVGLFNLERFGHWSGDEKVVYLRNHVKELDLEVLLHEGKYGEIVAGETG